MMDLLLINGRYPDFQAGEIKQANIGVCDGKMDCLGDGRGKFRAGGMDNF